MIPQDYRIAMDLLDEGVNRQAALRKRHGSASWDALLAPVEYADLVLRLAQFLAADYAAMQAAATQTTAR